MFKSKEKVVENEEPQRYPLIYQKSRMTSNSISKPITAKSKPPIQSSDYQKIRELKAYLREITNFPVSAEMYQTNSEIQQKGRRLASHSKSKELKSDVDIPNFDQYVLLTPGKEDSHYGYTSKSQNRNSTIDSKFRSAEKSNQKKLISGFDGGVSKQLLKSIDNYAYINCPMDKPENSIEKRISVRELDIRMKKAIK